MKLTIPSSCVVACICEGSAEKAIMDTLLDNDRLIFTREQLLGEEIIPRISVREFEKKYLRFEFEKKIIIMRVIDSRNEQFNLSKAYRCQIEVINVITAPEIEMLIIASKDKLLDYQKRRMKPSDYCKSVLKMRDVKSFKCVKAYFSDPDYLVESILKYQHYHKQKPKEASLFDLLKQEHTT